MAEILETGAAASNVKTPIKLGNARHLLDMTAPAHRVLSEIERWELDPVMNARDLLGGQIFDVRHSGAAAVPDDFANVTNIELLWLPKVQRGAVRHGSETDWIDALNPQELLQTWTNGQADDSGSA
jgi:hypothetical protein